MFCRSCITSGHPPNVSGFSIFCVNDANHRKKQAICVWVESLSYFRVLSWFWCSLAESVTHISPAFLPDQVQRKGQCVSSASGRKSSMWHCNFAQFVPKITLGSASGSKSVSVMSAQWKVWHCSVVPLELNYMYKLTPLHPP